MADFAKFKHGGVQYPQSGVSANTLLQDVDPTVYQLLDFYAGVLEIHLGARLITAAAAAGLTWAGAVAQKTPVDPTTYLKEAQYKFPLLALYRKAEKFEMHTRVWRKHWVTFGLAYVFPPLTPGQAEMLIPGLHAAGRVFDHATELGFDPSYQSGAKVMADAGLMQIEVQTAAYGSYQSTAGLDFPAYVAEVLCAERDMAPTGDLSAFGAADIEQDLVESGQTTLNNFVNSQTDVPPITEG